MPGRLLLACFAVWVSLSGPTFGAEKPNVVFILA